ncbi:uncharacterized protein N7511_009490 [Penicillium nucicola]|uniref:uncharacterized protein n=1 Tax=Penicillium nucicola TaxID=1850975 RepID=UPI002545220C|nr:uncharacterized protein N7511_009490 [Penicillium nucicola]KAJ5747794.1 hypothetical protein N7511_009490 [Penicillium nucicola]
MSEPRANNDFGQVVHGVYRSGFPNLQHNGQNLRGIRTILKLTDREYDDAEADYLIDHAVRILHPPLPRDPLRPNETPPRRNMQSELNMNSDIDRILEFVIDTRNHPILIHGDNGKHATGAMVGCFRRAQGWDPADIIHEYRRYAGATARHKDENFFCVYQPGQRLLELASHLNMTAWGSSRASDPRWFSSLRETESRESLQSHQGTQSLRGGENNQNDQGNQDQQSVQSSHRRRDNRGHRRNRSHQISQGSQSQQSRGERHRHWILW